MNKSGTGTVQLDERTVAYLEKMQAASRDAQIQAATAAAQPFLQRMCGAVDMFVEQNGLEGKWDLAPDMKSITRTDAPPNIAQKSSRKQK